jgi:hypothetical protein
MDVRDICPYPHGTRPHRLSSKDKIQFLLKDK